MLKKPTLFKTYISHTPGCIEFTDWLRSMRISSDVLGKSFADGVFMILRSVFDEKRDIFSRKLPDPYEYSKSYKNCNETFKISEYEGCYSSSTAKMPTDEKIEKEKKNQRRTLSKNWKRAQRAFKKLATEIDLQFFFAFFSTIVIDAFGR